MTIEEAMHKEFDRGKTVVYAAKISECHICHKTDELRAGVCWSCKSKVATDMIEVWELGKPKNRWPYIWIETEPEDISEETLQKLQDLVDKIDKEK